MWEYFWPDVAFNVVKGLVAGGASLAVQAVAPAAVRAVKRFGARWRARKAARERQAASRQLWRWRRLRR